MGQINKSTRKKWKQIDEKERYKIEALSRRGLSPCEIESVPGRDRRTIERELKLGLVEQMHMNRSNNKNAALTITEWVYRADTAQMGWDERAPNEGRGLKIGHDHKLAKYIEGKISNEKWSPDAVMGRIKAEGLNFETSICTKTLYNYIDRGIFSHAKHYRIAQPQNPSSGKVNLRERCFFLRSENSDSVILLKLLSV